MRVRVQGGISTCISSRIFHAGATPPSASRPIIGGVPETGRSAVLRSLLRAAVPLAAATVVLAGCSPLVNDRNVVREPCVETGDHGCVSESEYEELVQGGRRDACGGVELPEPVGDWRQSAPIAPTRISSCSRAPTPRPAKASPSAWWIRGLTLDTRVSETRTSSSASCLAPSVIGETAFPTAPRWPASLPGRNTPAWLPTPTAWPGAPTS